MTSAITVITGANSEIAKAIAQQHCQLALGPLVLISRDLSFYHGSEFIDAIKITVPDYSEQSIANAVANIQENLASPEITRLFVCHGLLHTHNISPEKKIDDFNSDNFARIMAVNAITPMLWLKHLLVLMSQVQVCHVMSWC